MDKTQKFHQSSSFLHQDYLPASPSPYISTPSPPVFFVQALLQSPVTKDSLLSSIFSLLPSLEAQALEIAKLLLVQEVEVKTVQMFIMHKNAPPGFHRHPTFAPQCTHATMTRIYSPALLCSSCRYPGPSGWLYQCTQDREDLIEHAVKQGEFV